MPPWLLAPLAAALVATAPAAAGELDGALARDELGLAPLPVEELPELAEGALPPPPSMIVRQTRYYGTVTIDHRAHLARRAPCRTCHGPGVVSKLALTPKIAHERCIGCHQAQAKGPAQCAGCHVRPAPSDTAVAAQPENADAGPAAPPRPPGPDAANVAAALAAFDAPGASRGLARAEEPFHRVLELGLAAGDGLGASLRLVSRQDSVIVSHGFERVRSGATTRTFALLGAGHSQPVHPRTSFDAVALAGFDVLDRPVVALLPAVGVRAGVDWRPRSGLFRHVLASLTGVVDLSRSASGRQVGGVTVYATVGTGFGVP